MTATHYLVLLAAWLMWMIPFFLIKRTGVKRQQLDRRARWGILLEGVGFFLVWQGPFWLRVPAMWRTVLSGTCFIVAGVLSWTGTRVLGAQWRIDAGLNEQHDLITTGPYSVVRHPIYASMLCMLLGTGLLLTPLPVLLAAMILFIAGTEIRVRVEDALLASRFGPRFEDYQRRVPAYIPFLR